MTSTEQHIREFAYQIWLSEGKPHGHAKRHWEMATKLALSQAAGDATQSVSADKPKAKRVSKKLLANSETAVIATSAKKVKASSPVATLPEEKKVKAKTSEKAAAKKPAVSKKKITENQLI